MRPKLMLHPLDRAGLAGVVSHPRGHGMALGGAWMLLHPDGVRRKRRAHHLDYCQLSTAWISTSSPPRYRMRSLACVAIIQCVGILATNEESAGVGRARTRVVGNPPCARGKLRTCVREHNGRRNEVR